MNRAPEDDTVHACPDAAGAAPRWKIDTVSEEAVGAGNGTRTRDIKLGKLALYQLSYARIPEICYHILQRNRVKETYNKRHETTEPQ